MHITLLGKRWNLRFVPTLGPNKRGDCDAPSTRGKQIRVEASLKNREQLEVLIHEMLHATNWPLDEEFVEQAAHDMSAALWKIGYRKCE